MIFHQPHNSQSSHSYNAYIYQDLEFQPHFHRNFEVIYVFSGQVEVNINGRNTLLTAGDLAFCLSNEIHQYRTPEHSATWVGVFSGDFVPEFEKSIRGKTGRNCRFHCSESTLAYLKEHLFHAGPPDFYSLAASLYMLCGEYLRQITLTDRSCREYALMNDTVDYISQNFRRRLTLAEVARALGYDHCYFSKIFHSAFGVCFSDYLNTCRFNAAAEALLTSNDSITAIALESGFQSIRSFNEVFRKKAGMTPAQYRKALQK